ncbi:hypothetical protein M885DRAFT_567145, partial [Pelagophyceae sp. CCMP2097]
MSTLKKRQAPALTEVDSAADDDVSAHGQAADAPKDAKKVQKTTPPAGDDVSAHGHAAAEPPKVAKKVQKAAPDMTRTVTTDAPKKGRAVFFVHAKLTQSVKGAALNGFRDATDAVLVCTNSAIIGVDHPNVTQIFKFRLPLWIGDDLQLDGRGARNPRITSTSTLLYNRSMIAASFHIIRHSPEAIARFTGVIALAENLVLCHRSFLSKMLGEVATARVASSCTSCCAT